MSLAKFSTDELKKELKDREAPIKKYKPADLSVLAYANNFTLWHYTTTDLSVQTPGYFNDAVTMLRKNDLLIVNTSTAANSPVMKFYIVTANDTNSVTVTAYA